MTTFTLTIGGKSYTALKSLEINPLSVGLGHGKWEVRLDNTDGAFNADIGLTSAGGKTIYPQAPVVITLNGATIPAGCGYVDNCEHLYKNGVEDLHLDVLRVFGRDYSQDLSNLKLSKLYLPATHAVDIIDDALTVAGQDDDPLGSVSEITYAVDPANTTTIGGYLAQDTFLFNLFKDVCERANLEGYVNASKALQLWSVASAPSSGLTITDSDILVDGFNRFLEFDGLSIRNKATVYGAPTKMYPATQDGLTEPLQNNEASEQTENSISYTLKHSHEIEASADEHVTTFKVHVDTHYTVALTTGFYKITYQETGGAETTIVTDQPIDTVAYNTDSHIYNLQGGLSKHVTVRYYIRCGIVDDTVYIQNCKVDYMVDTGYWKELILDDNLHLTVDTTTFVQGSKSIVSSSSGVDYNRCIYYMPYNPISLLFQRDYDTLHFKVYITASAGTTEWLKIYLTSASGVDHFYYTILEPGLNTWHEYNLPLGLSAVDWVLTGGTDARDWQSIDGIKFYYSNSVNANISVYIDDLQIRDNREKGLSSDTTSQTNYRKREVVENLNKATSGEVSDYATNLKNKLLSPPKMLKLCLKGTTGLSGANCFWLPGYKFTVTLADLGISAQEYRLTDIRLVYVPRTPQAGGEDFIAQASLVPATSTLDAFSLTALQNPSLGPQIIRLNSKIDRINT